MGFDFVSTIDPDFGTVEQYFQDYGRQRAIWLAQKGGFDTVEDEDGTVQLVEREKVEKTRGFRVIEAYDRIEAKTLGSSPKALATALEAMGWRVSTWRQLGEHDEVVYLNDSKEGDANQHNAGDTRYPATVVRRYCVEGRFGEHPVGIQAFYEGDGEEGNSASFQSCRIRDSAYGILYTPNIDYTRSKKEAQDRGWNEERRIQEGMAMNRRYAVEPYRVHTIHYTAADPMNQWVDLYLDLTKTENGGRRLTRKKPSTAVEKRVDDLTLMREGGEWQG